MSVIVPLELQRKCEQRWAARFRQPMTTASQSQATEKSQEQPPTTQANS
jgi:hypothetical protein